MASSNRGIRVAGEMLEAPVIWLLTTVALPSPIPLSHPSQGAGVTHRRTAETTYDVYERFAVDIRITYCGA